MTGNGRGGAARAAVRARAVGARTRWALAGWALAAAALAVSSPVGAQDSNILLPVDSIEWRMSNASFDVLDSRGSRFEGDRTSRAALSFPDQTLIAVKWGRAPTGGEAFNNSPRLELAAYEVQKLFLDAPEYVVPPTVVRAFPLSWYTQVNGPTQPTFTGTASVLVTLQYWLLNVTPDGIWDADRFESDTTYARHFGNFNLLTYLIRHNDSNVGNFLISRDAGNPRVFAVDNGLSFNSATSDRGADFRRLRVRRLPAETVERLRSLSYDDVVARLGTMAEWSIGADGVLRPVEPGPSLSGNRGVRREADRIQMGLTEREMRDLWRRVESVLRDVDRGRITVF